MYQTEAPVPPPGPNLGDIKVVGVYNRYVNGVWDNGPVVECSATAKRAEWWEIREYTIAEDHRIRWGDPGETLPDGTEAGGEYDSLHQARSDARKLRAMRKAQLQTPWPQDTGRLDALAYRSPPSGADPLYMKGYAEGVAEAEVRLRHQLWQRRRA